MAMNEVRKFVGHNSEVLSVAFLPDGRRAISSGMNIIVWDLQTGFPLFTFVGHTAPVMTISPSPDGRYAISGGWDETIRLLDLHNYQEVTKISAHKFGVSNVIFSPDGRFALSGSDHLKRFSYKSSHSSLWSATAILTQKQSDYDESVKLWDLSTSKQLKKWTIPFYCSSLAWSLDGRYVAWGEMNRVRIFEAQTWKEIRRFAGAIKAKWAAADVRALAFSPNGQLLTTVGKDVKVHLWDVASGDLVREFVGHEGGINCVAYSPDGNYVLSGGEDKTIILWNANSGTLVARCFGHTARINSAAFSRDMQYILSGSDDGTLRLWSVPGSPITPASPSINASTAQFADAQGPKISSQPPPPPPPQTLSRPVRTGTEAPTQGTTAGTEYPTVSRVGTKADKLSPEEERMKEKQELQAELDMLDKRLVEGKISETTYNAIRERLQSKLDKL